MKKLLTILTAVLVVGSMITAQAQDIAPIGGKFIISAKGDTAVFSRGNLQYQQSTGIWRCALNQYDWAGEAANEQMGNSASEEWVDLFSWSLGAENNYGATSAYLSTAYHNKDFVDWGGLFTDELSWSTLSSSQWSYLLNSRTGANDKWGMALIGDNLGMILLPDDWTAPSGVTFVPRNVPTSELWDDDDMIDATYDHYRVKVANMPANKFSLSEWAALEAAGAIFLPYAGRRSGGVGNHTNRDDETVSAEYNYTYYENYLGTYWTSTAATKTKGTANYVYTFKYDGDYNWGKAVIWSENGRYGQSVRLANVRPRQYTVTYDPNGAEGALIGDENTYLDGETITLASASSLSKAGYVFAGWKFKGQVYNDTYTVNNVLRDEEIVFEAQWEKDWQIVRGSLSADRFYTLCFEKTMNEIRGASLWQFLNKEANFVNIVEAVAPFVAGTPYLILAESDKLEAVVVEVTSPVAGNHNGLYGTFSYMDATDLSDAGADYMLFNNEIRPLGVNNHLDANRAYIKLDEIPSSAAPAPGRRVRKMPMQPKMPTSFENIDASETPMKLMIDGQIYILRGEKIYDTTGRLVK